MRTDIDSLEIAEKEAIKHLDAYRLALLGERPPCPYNKIATNPGTFKDTPYCEKQGIYLKAPCECMMVNSNPPVYENFCKDRFKIDDVLGMLDPSNVVYKLCIKLRTEKRCDTDRKASKQVKITEL